jgi:hypothetical protein
MKYTSADIFAAIEKVNQKQQAYEVKEDKHGKERDKLCGVLCDLRVIVYAVHKQENFSPELQDAYNIANFVLDETDSKYAFEILEDRIIYPSLRYTSTYTADAIRTFQKGSKKEIEFALEDMGVFTDTLSEFSREGIDSPEEHASADEVANMVNVAKFVSSMIVERMQKEELESITDEAA